MWFKSIERQVIISASSLINKDQMPMSYLVFALEK